MLLKDAIGSPVAATLADYSCPALMLPRLLARDTAGVVKELSQVLQAEGCVPDVLQFYHAVLNREFLVNTAMDFGIAFPHARLTGLTAPRFALGRTAEPIAWGGKGSQKVEFVFLLAVPATDAAAYLHVLAGLAKLGQQPRFMDSMRAARTRDDMFTVLQQIRLRQGT